MLVALAGTAAPAVAKPTPPLDHEGRWFTDARGRVVILHGFNMVHKVGSYRPEDTGFGRDDARFLRRHGFNTIRLGIIYKGLEPNPPGEDGEPGYERGYLRSIARTERLLAEHGVFSLLDFHQDLYNERYEGEGWPDWQALDDGIPPEPKNGFPINYLSMPALNRAYDHFWANDPAEGIPLQEAYARAWRHVAARFKRKRYVVGYDLLNEPWPGSTYPTCTSPGGCPAFDAGPLTELSNRVIATIREVDRETLAFYEPLLTFDFGAPTYHGDTGDESAGFSFHNYCLTGLFGPASATCEELETLVFENADGHSESTGDVLFLTEFGASDDLVDTERVVSLADEHMTSWQYWHYCDCDDPTTSGPGVQSVVKDPRKPPRGKNVKREKLEVLARPYPRAIAGTPESFGYDGDTGTFELTYSTIRASDASRAAAGADPLPRRVQTEVVIPKLNYRRGYRADVEGARITSRRNASVLKLKRARDAEQVSLTVERQ